jgi:hypothetical protein
MVLGSRPESPSPRSPPSKRSEEIRRRSSGPKALPSPSRSRLQPPPHAVFRAPRRDPRRSGGRWPHAGSPRGLD